MGRFSYSDHCLSPQSTITDTQDISYDTPSYPSYDPSYDPSYGLSYAASCGASNAMDGRSDVPLDETGWSDNEDSLSVLSCLVGEDPPSPYSRGSQGPHTPRGPQSRPQSGPHSLPQPSQPQSGPVPQSGPQPLRSEVPIGPDGHLGPESPMGSGSMGTEWPESRPQTRPQTRPESPRHQPLSYLTHRSFYRDPSTVDTPSSLHLQLKQHLSQHLRKKKT